MKALVFSIFLLMVVVDTFPQKPPEKEIDLERLSDELLGFQEADVNYEDIYENLAQILSSPYDLNKVTAEELTLLHLLSDLQIRNFIHYRNAQGRLLDIYELQIIPAFDLNVISKLLPFVTVSDPSNRIDHTLLHRIFSGNSYFISRYERTFETRKGFKPTEDISRRFMGSEDKWYFRFRSSKPGDFSIGFTGEKDAGEKILFNSAAHQYGFDFSSYHVQLQNKGKLKNIIIGDFQTQFAQGLLLGGAFGLGKGGETVSTTRRSHLGFLPYTSINESVYLRGVAVTWQPWKKIDISAFYSATKRDASESTDADTLTVTSFQTTGYHRSQREMEKRKNVTEQNYGLVVHYRKNRLDAGLIFNAIHFDIPVSREPTPYNQSTFKGSGNLNTGVFMNYHLGNFSFFSEAAKSINGGKGGVAGLLINAHKNFDLSILYRKYDRDFHTFYSNAFSENTQPQNERGLYWGWKYRWNRKYTLTGYTDLFTFPWLSFRRYAPSGGYEWLLRGNYQPSKKISVYFQVREESKSRNLQEAGNLYQLGEGLKRNLSLNCDYGIGEKVRLKSRMQYSSYSFHGKSTEGFTLLQDISFVTGRFKFTGRHALFDTDNYDNRQYVYEKDAWSAYSLPAYSGMGVRNYALIEYKIHKHLTIWLRYARTRLSGEVEIGSGQDLIAGNTKNDVKFQARIKF